MFAQNIFGILLNYNRVHNFRSHRSSTLLSTGFYCKSQYYFKSICRQEKIRVFRYRINFVGELSCNFDDRVSNLTRCICWLHKNKLEKFFDFVTTVSRKRQEIGEKNTFQLTLTPFGRDVLFKPQRTTLHEFFDFTEIFAFKVSKRVAFDSSGISNDFFSINYTGDDRYDYPRGDALAIVG